MAGGRLLRSGTVVKIDGVMLGDVDEGWLLYLVGD